MSDLTAEQIQQGRGPDRKTLHVVSGKGVYKISTTVAGYALYPPLGR